MRDGHLAQDDDGKVSIVDPVLADWLQRTFPVTSFVTRVGPATCRVGMAKQSES